MKALPFLKTVRARLTFWNVLVLAFVLLILGSVLRVTVEHNLMASIDENISSRAKGSQWFWGMFFTNGPGARMAGRSSNTPPGRRRGGPPPMFAAPISPSRWQARMEEKSLDVNGKRFFSNAKDRPLDHMSFVKALFGEKNYTIVTIDGVRVRIVSAPIHAASRVVGVVQVGYALDDMDRALRNLDRTLLTLVPFALLAAGAVGLFLTRRMLRPLREVTAAADRIGAEDLARRLPVHGSDEFSGLATTINEMLGRLERSFEQQRRFTADASHELRTPLTVIKANTSLALSRGDLTPTYRKAFESVDKAASFMNALVQDLLLLARSDNGQLELTLHPTPLLEVLEAAAAYVRNPGTATIRIVTETPQLFVRGDPHHLTRLFINLLDNAVRHTPADGCITLTVEADETVVRTTVEDTGSGIAPEHLPHVCERFFRADEARSRMHGGTGLGLAICKTISRAHGGDMEIRSALGVGTAVTVSLLRARPEEADPSTSEPMEARHAGEFVASRADTPIERS